MKSRGGFLTTSPAITLTALFVAALFIALPPSTVQSAPNTHPRDAAISQAVEYCSDRMAPTSPQYWYRWQAIDSLNQDQTVLCFDGPISDDVDFTPFSLLREHGILVIRSAKGNDHVAMAIADLLWNKDVTVAVRDFCLASCALGIAIASTKTIILENSIVAWRALASGCQQSEVGRLAARVPPPCYNPAAIDDFFGRRNIGRLHTIAPPTRYTKQRVSIIVRSRSDPRSVLWMWHPKNHGDYFRDRLVYERYPEDQGAVDAIINRFGLHLRVVYDPDD